MLGARLAAAAANPQLAKTLDPKSGVADNYTLLGVLGKGSYGEVKLRILTDNEHIESIFSGAKNISIYRRYLVV